MKKGLITVLILIMVFSFVFAEGAKEAEKSDVNWPEKPIEIICPYKAGGDSDAYLRAIAPKIGDILGVNCVVTNMGGESLSAITEYLKRENDGYTVFYYNTSMHASEASGKYGKYTMMDNMVPAGVIVSDNNSGLFVRKDSGIKTMNDFLAKAKSDPNFKFATGTLNAEYFLSNEIAKISGIDFTFVAQASSISDRILQLLSGEVDAIFGTYGSVAPYIEKGDVVCVGLLSEQRSDKLPDLPTLEEQGIAVFNPKRYLFRMKNGTNQAIVDKFSAAVKQAVETDCLDKPCSIYLSEKLYMNPADQGAWEVQRIAEMKKAFGK